MNCAKRSRNFLFVCFSLLFTFGVGCSADKTGEVQKKATVSATKSFEAMNTFMTVKSFGVEPDRANDSVKILVDGLEKHLSTTLQNSDIYKLNHSSGESILVAKPVADLVAFALKMAQSTDGALNPALYPVVRAWGFTTEEYRVPPDSEITKLLAYTNYRKIRVDTALAGAKITLAPQMMVDLGAVGKGYAGDKAIDLLRRQGITSAVLDLGGNVQTLGCKPDGKPWKVGVTNPWGGPALGGVSVCDKAVISSGGYERYFEQNGKRYIHIFDAASGRPVENGLASVTIIAKSGMYADALSTAMFVKGVDGAVDYWKKHRDFDMILVTSERELYYTAGIRDVLKVVYLFDKVVVIE